ncbi:hypothetical protein [Pseudoruegeria sp. SK021]|uniref:hypothetical protein n=1 Tax=Pseudoruegeria sp. SK021 TaxID=1933035 RepID=UPI000A23ABC3|nr:hypothetical protein [Pseudoruegeria sp. SK021]OSP56733.1 hypothetical protein BV911_01935 [Pseudoruegeria sp. SK021]
MVRALVLSCLCLAACASPEDRCLRRATADLRTVNALIAETEVNIARGYAYVLEPSPVQIGFDICTGGGGGFLFCTGDTNRVQRRAVAIDAAEEGRKLASLRAKQAELQTATAGPVQACQAPVGTPG